MVWKPPISTKSIEKIDLVSLKISKEFDNRIRSLIWVDKKYIDHYSMGIIWTKRVWDVIIVSFVDIKSRDELYDILVNHVV